MSRRRPANGSPVIRQPLIVSFDREGGVVDIVGDIATVLGNADAPEASIARLRDLLVGGEGRPMSLPAFDLGDGRYVDIHLLQEGHELQHMVILDNSETMRSLQKHQQAGNEAALAQERQMKRLSRQPESDAHGERLADVFRRSATVFTAIANDMRAPLATLSGHARILAKRYDADPVARRSIAAIQHAVSRLDALSRNGLIGLSGVPTGESTPDILDLRRLATWVEDTFSLQAECLGMHMEIRVSESRGPVIVDDPTVRQILANLLIHAFDGVEDGGLQVTIAATERYLDIELSREPDGFSPALFGPLVTTSDLLQTHASGSFPLAVSQALLRSLRARIDIVPLEEGGTLLSCRIPLSRPVNDHD